VADPFLGDIDGLTHTHTDKAVRPVDSATAAGQIGVTTAAAAAPAEETEHPRPSRSSSHVRLHIDDGEQLELSSVMSSPPVRSSPPTIITSGLRQSAPEQAKGLGARKASNNPSIAFHHNDPAPHPKEVDLSPPVIIRDTSRLKHEVSRSRLDLALAQPVPAIAAPAEAAPPAAKPEKAPADVGEATQEMPEATRQMFTEAMAVADVEHGLAADVVERQRAKHGFNETVEKQTPLWLLFLHKFHGPVPYMIIIAMIVAFALQKWPDGGVIGVLLLFNGCLAFNEDLRARRALQELMKSLQVMTRAIREGEWKEIAARELVPGDLIRLRTGDIAGADVCVLNGHLSVDQSALTGESDLKSIQREGLLYSGSIIKRGEANAVVVAIGANTYFGKTAQLVQASKPSPHIQRILTRIVGILMSLILVLVVATLIVLGVKGDDIGDAIPLLLMVIITALPVALPPMFTVSMALGSQELSKRNVLVTRLNVIEDCALMSILFSDKTGTLSQNMMSVKSVVPLLAGATERDVLVAAALCSRRENADPIDRAVLNAMDDRTAAGSLHENDSRIPSSAVVEGQEVLNVKALLPGDAAKQYNVLRFIPFDASNRRTEAIVQSGKNNAGDVVRVTKGAVATLCVAAGIPLASDAYAKIDALVEQNARKGHKSLAVGIGVLSEEERAIDYEEEERQALLAAGSQDPHEHHAAPAAPQGLPQFRLLGMVSLHDPPREDSAAVIAKLKSLGIATKMLTGDSIGVAVEMGRALSLGSEFINLEHEKQLLRAAWQKEKEARAVIAREEAGKNLLHADAPVGGADEVRLIVSDDAAEETPAEQEKRLMAQLLARFDPMSITGFAQIFPADKHAIVQYAQSKHFVCGMTGDGVNDAPALKQAEVGCAVSNATDVAKGSASALLLKDGLSGVPDMVEVGRQVHARVSVWVINKVAKAAMHSTFILILFLILGRFPVTALQVVLLLLLMDFVLISIATDTQPPGHSPSRWNLAQLTRVGLSIGVPGATQILVLILVTDYLYDQPVEESQTMAWLAMFTWGMLAVFAAREKSFFWKSRPSNVMLSLVLLEEVAVWLVCSLGVPELPKIGFAMASAVVGIGFGCFILNDTIKVLYIRLCEKSYLDALTPEEHDRKRRAGAVGKAEVREEMTPLSRHNTLEQRVQATSTTAAPSQQATPMQTPRMLNNQV